MFGWQFGKYFEFDNNLGAIYTCIGSTVTENSTEEGIDTLSAQAFNYFKIQIRNEIVSTNKVEVGTISRPNGIRSTFRLENACVDTNEDII